MTAAVRISVGGAALLKLLILHGDLQAVDDPGRLTVPWVAWMPAADPILTRSLIVCWLGSALAFTLGWRTRWSGTLLLACVILTLGLDRQLYSNHLYLLAWLVGLLVLARSGARWSLDARRRGPRTIPRWPVFLLKTQLSTVYLFAGLAKLNLVYVSGAVLAVHWRWGGWSGLPEALRRVEVLMPLAVASILAEVFVALGLWSARLRPAAVVVGVLLHLGMIVLMNTTPRLEFVLFALLCLPLYLLFLPAPPVGAEAADMAAGASPTPLTPAETRTRRS